MAELGKKRQFHYRRLGASLFLLACFLLCMTTVEGSPQKKRIHDDGKPKKHKMSDERNSGAPINPDSVVALEVKKPARRRERMVKGEGIPKRSRDMSLDEETEQVERKAKMAHGDRRSYRTKTRIEFSHAEHVLTDEAESFQVSGKTKQGVVARRNLRG
jgi:hypothetical protein